MPRLGHRLLMAAMIATSFGLSGIALAQLPQLSGVSDFLCGYWTNRGGQSSRVMLQNPSEVIRGAVVLYYDDEEHFLDCRFLVLSTHDFEVVTPTPLTSVWQSLAGKAGAVEILSAPSSRYQEDPDRPGGLIGYIEIRQGELGQEPFDSIVTRGVAPLFPVDKRLFNIASENRQAIATCVCPKLKDIEGTSLLQAKFMCLE